RGCAGTTGPSQARWRRRPAARRAAPRTGMRAAPGRARSSGAAGRPRVPVLRVPSRRTRLTLAHRTWGTGPIGGNSHRPHASAPRTRECGTAEGRNVTLRGVTTLPRIKTTGEPEDAAPSFAAFREVPRTGVIYVTTEAQRRGYSSASED